MITITSTNGSKVVKVVDSGGDIHYISKSTGFEYDDESEFITLFKHDGDKISFDVGDLTLTDIGIGSPTVSQKLDYLESSIFFLDEGSSNKLGWGFYSDDNSSSITVGTTPTRLTIDGLGGTTETSYLKQGDNQYWDTTNNLILPNAVGEAYDTRVQLTITSTSSNPTRLIMKLDIGATPDGTGGAGSIIITEDSKTLRTGTPQTHAFSLPIFCLPTFNANGGSLWLQCNSGSAVVGTRSIFVIKTFEP